MNPIALIAQFASIAEYQMTVIWLLIALVFILVVAVVVFLFKIGGNKSTKLTEYEETQVYELTKRALVKAIEEYESGKTKQTENKKVEKLAPINQKEQAKTDDKPKSERLRVPYRRTQ